VSYGDAYRCDRCGETTELRPPNDMIFERTLPKVSAQLTPPFGWGCVLRANEDRVEGSFWHLCTRCTDECASWIGEGR